MLGSELEIVRTLGYPGDRVHEGCSFCGERPVVAWFVGPSFRRTVQDVSRVGTEDAWGACPVCVVLVGRDDRDGLAQTVAGSIGGGVDPGRAVVVTRRYHDRAFWAFRDMR